MIEMFYLADNWEVARQSATQHLFIFVSPWDLPRSTCLQEMESDCIWHTPLEGCFLTSWNLWTACWITWVSAWAHQVSCM